MMLKDTKDTKISRTLEMSSILQNRWTFIIIGLLALYIGLSILFGVSENQEQLQEYDVVMQEKETNKVTFIEADDNTDYSYIVNPGMLDGRGIGAESIQIIPDEINRVFKSKNIKGERLEITYAEEKGNKVCFTVKVIDKDIKLECEFNKQLGTISCK